MWPTTPRFRATIAGSHRAVVRARLLKTIQFGVNPTGGTELPVLAGDVKMSGTADIKATATLEVPGDYWGQVQPYGAEVFLERGIDFGDHTREYVPLGYYRIDKVNQAVAPYGPISIDGSDRTAQLQQNRTIYPYQVASGITHRALVDRLVNGDDSGFGGYGMYLRRPSVPVVWDAAGYNPDTATVASNLVVEQSIYEFLAKLVDARNATLRFLPTGELAVQARDPDPDDPATYTIRGGPTGTLISASRSVSRDGVYNMVRATGSDPAAPTGYRLAYIGDAQNPLRWYGPFGPAVRYYASPLLRTSEQAQDGATSVLGRVTGLPTELGLYTVPDPSLQPGDVVSVQLGAAAARHVIDEVTIPLVGDQAVQIRTRTLNPVGQTENDPDPPPPPPPTPDPGPGPGPGPGGDPADGTQAAVTLGWGPVIDGDEFAYSGAPNSKWAMYNGPGHAGNGLRRPSAFNVAGGILTCTGDNVSGGTSGGMAFRRDQKYWRIEWRVRTYSVNPGAGGNKYHPVLLFWPTDNQWPRGGELDFFECNCDSGKLGWFIHYPNHQPKVQEGGERPLDIQNWHNYAMEWSSSRIAGWFDGQMYFEYRQANIQPPGPMHFTIQLDNFFGANMNPAKFEAQWVRVYAAPAG